MFVEADEHQSGLPWSPCALKLLQMVRNALQMPSVRSRLDSINPPEYQPSPQYETYRLDIRNCHDASPNCSPPDLLRVRDTDSIFEMPRTPPHSCFGLVSHQE